MEDLEKKQAESKPKTFSEAVQNNVPETETKDVKRQVIEDSAREIEDREGRKDKLVWFGVPESDATDGEARKKDDLSFMKKMGGKVFDIKQEGVFQNAARLGRKGDNCRPLLTTLDSGKRVGEFLKKARELRAEGNEEYKDISVKRDMTPLERGEMRKLIKLRNEKREQATQEGTGENWVIRKGRVVNVTRGKMGTEAAG
jgi:hypothetical protein